MGQQERRPKVHRHRQIPVCRAVSFHRADKSDTCAVHKNIDAWVKRQRLIHQPLTSVYPRQIRADDVARSPGFADPTRQSGQAPCILPGRDHLGPRLGKKLCNGLADPRRRARDQRHPTLDRKSLFPARIRHSRFVWLARMTSGSVPDTSRM